ncbi:hypothetical protein PS659_03981 [Pseudomonas fluorescens]|uniref:Uncharacterized protein n=1 Tax=Pseudomonas fluorescens TaxID=294 RepID=A0A5E6VMD3_PSEFL|nr:hypothetical protein PS659_03981 [Pseudomonas fluorescens]
MFRIQRCQCSEQAGWLPLRQALWPHASEQEHRDEIGQQLSEPQRYINFVAYDSREQPVGLAEASLRHDYVNGTDNSPVVFLEGIYVAPEPRAASPKRGRTIDRVCSAMGARTGLCANGLRHRPRQSGEPGDTHSARLRRNRARRVFQAPALTRALHWQTSTHYAPGSAPTAARTKATAPALAAAASSPLAG